MIYLFQMFTLLIQYHVKSNKIFAFPKKNIHNLPQVYLNQASNL